MKQTVIVCYRPKEGKVKDLIALVDEHVPLWVEEQLATDRTPFIMQAKDGTIVEIFEWISAGAIEVAHKRPAVLTLWQRFNEVCDYVSPNGLAEFQHIFSTFNTVE